MQKNALTIMIDAPVETVFPYLITGGLRRQWIDGLRRSVYRPGGPPKPGSLLEEIVYVRGKEYTVTASVVEFVPDNRLVLSHTTEGFKATISYAVESAPGDARPGTEASFVQERVYTSWLADRMGALVTRAAQRKFEADFAALRRLIESGSDHAR